ncbi:MAG: cytochrome c3 family protein [Chthoniobacterales bacterium]
MTFLRISKPLLAWVVSVFVLFTIAAAIWAVAPDYASVRAGRADAGYLESGDCRKCHETNYASWHATFHRTMTQEANPTSMLGDFERENTITYQGVRSEMVREKGAYWMKFTGIDGVTQQLQIVRTVGSRRIQQYLVKTGDAWFRMPIAYDLMQRRWMHLNGSFFFPDGSDYKQHVAEWNVNCVFCHNVKAQPGLDWEKRTWQTEVAELGVACGACHGPAGEHAQRALSPLTRLRWNLKDEIAPERLVVHPAKINSDRSAMICGHCHGQRLADPQHRIRPMMSVGDPYDPGENLREFYKPVQRDDKVESFSFASRFWDDGSPRLTAYEYQGLTRSKCFTAGQPGARLTCISCHSMHAGDPRGQLTEKMKTNAACTQCHEQFAAPTQLVEHTKHSATSTGSLCYNCHMPKIVYGIMTAHRTHDITNPRPDETVRFGKPNACNQCHLDWSANQTIATTQRLWPKTLAQSEPHDPRFDEPEGQRALFAGDAVHRALTVAAMTPATDATGPLLLEAMQDNYPIVRYFAANALAALHPNLPKPDYLAPVLVRAATLAIWSPLWAPERLQAARAARERLTPLRSETDVEVGE